MQAQLQQKRDLRPYASSLLLSKKAFSPTTSSNIRFGKGLGEQGFYALLGKIEARPLLDTLIKEIVGINLFKIIFTRSKDERLDVGVSEIGNTVAFATGGLAVDKSLSRLYKNAAKGSLNPETARRFGIIGRSFALYSIIFSLLWAMPFVRNYITSRRIGSDRFTDVIKRQQGPRQAEQQHLKQSLDYYKRQIAGILGLGVTGTLIAGALGFIGIRHTAKPGKVLGEKILARFFQEKPASVWKKLLLIEEGRFANFAGFPALLFWGVPAYGGWIHASRDTYEKKEQVLKFANFVACFFGPSLLLNKFYEKKFTPLLGAEKATFANIQKLGEQTLAEQAIKQKALKLWAGKNGLGLLSSVLLLGTMPQLINIHLTKKRLQRAQQAGRIDIYKPSQARHVLNGSLPVRG